MKAFIIYSTYTTQENQTYVQLFGRLENNQSFVTINKFQPYFYIKKKDKNKLPKKYKQEETSLKNFQNQEVIKVLFPTRTELSNEYKKLKKKIRIYEADLRPQYRFLFDKKIFGAINIDGDYQSSEKIDRLYQEPKITPIENYKPKIKVLAIDTELGKNGELYCIGLYGDNYQKNFMITDKKLKHTIPCKDEPDCLEKFKAELLKLDPDILTGWNVIDFDFAYLRDLFQKHKIKFDIARTNDEPRLRIESNFFRSSTIDIPGRQVLDGLNLIKDPFIKEAPTIKHAEFKSLTLEDVSQALLKKGKLLKGANRHDEIEKLYKTNTLSSLQKLVDYNILDCQLVYELLEKTKIIELALERSQLTGMPLDRLSGSIAAFDSLYIREANSQDLVSPTSEYKQKQERIKGGYVQSVKPGLYKNVLVLDFNALYSSIIMTFNIDPSSFLERKQEDCIQAPNKACFKNQEGILPQILKRLQREREQAKKSGQELKNHALKVTMNSFWGVLASPNLRYFDLRMANAITHFGQFLIKLTAKEIEAKGYKVTYSDTDSVFVETNLSKEKANSLGSEIEEEINKFYKEYIKENYNRESHLKLEFEKQYLYLMIPKLRGGEKAAKKRYAGLVEKSGKEEVEIVGLEAIRGDWTQAAQEFQKELLKKLFHEEPVEQFIKEYIKKIQQGKLDEKLLYRKSIRKSLDQYTKTTPPHVKAARKLDKIESNIIEYYVTLAGPEPLQKLHHKIDYKHYIEKQIKPIANQILILLNKDFDDVVMGSKQSKLF